MTLPDPERPSDPAASLSASSPLPPPPTESGRSRGYLELPLFLQLPAGLMLFGVIGLFAVGLVRILFAPIEANAVAGLPLAGWPLLTTNSIVFSLLAAAVSLLIALPPAVSLRHAGARRWLALAAVAAAAAIPWIVTATGWTQTPLVFGQAGRQLEGWIKQPTADQDTLRLLLGGGVQGLMGAPLALLLLSVFLPPPTSEEEAALLAGSRWQVFQQVFLPLARLPLITAFAVLLLWHFNDFTICDLLRIPTWSTRVFTTTAGLSPTLAMREYLWMAAFNAGGFVLLALALTRLARRHAAERLDHDLPAAAALRPRRAFRLAGWLMFAVLACLWPLLALVIRLWQSADASPRSMVEGLQNSAGPWFEGLQVAFASGLLAAVLGIGFGVLCVGRVRMLRAVAWLTAGLFLAMASIGIALPLKAAQQAFHGVVALQHSHFFEILAALLRALPWCMLLTVWHLYQLPRNFDEAARVDGANPGQVFRSLLMPYLAPLLPVAFFLGFVMASLDLAPAVLLSPPGRQPLIVRLFNELHYDYNSNLIVIALLIALPFPLIAAPVAAWFARRARPAAEVGNPAVERNDLQ